MQIFLRCYGNVVWPNGGYNFKLQKISVIPLSTISLVTLWRLSQNIDCLIAIFPIIRYKEISSTIYGSKWITHELSKFTYWNFIKVSLSTTLVLDGWRILCCSIVIASFREITCLWEHKNAYTTFLKSFDYFRFTLRQSISNVQMTHIFSGSVLKE